MFSESRTEIAEYYEKRLSDEDLQGWVVSRRN